MPREIEKGRGSIQQQPLTVTINGKKPLSCRDSASGASSESGDSHEIKFTQKEGCTLCTCACIFLAIAFVGLGCAAGIYFGLQFLSANSNRDRVFKGKLMILEGDRFTEELSDSASEIFEKKSEFYRNKLDELYNNSIVKESYHHSEIIMLEKSNGSKLTVHFNIHLQPEKPDVEAADLYFVLSEEVMRNEATVFKGLKIDHQSVNIQERKSSLDAHMDPWSPRKQYPGSLVGLTTKSPSDGPRKCGAIGLDFCQSLPYNATSYPNIIGHRNMKEVMSDVISFRQIIDFECYVMAQEFICNLLQPNCKDDKMIPPCKEFCSDFQEACKTLLPKEVEEKLNCSALPKSGGNQECTLQPGCDEELRARGNSDLICDGIYDCLDYSDENRCDKCKENEFSCGSQKQCVAKIKRCDSFKDCKNGADERGCLYLDARITNGTKHSKPTTSKSGEFRYYQQKGFVISLDNEDRTNRVCLENSNNSLSLARREIMLRHLATSVCSQLNYKSADLVETRTDPEINANYSKLAEPLTSPVSFQKARCDNKQAVFVECKGLECGKRPAAFQSNDRHEAVRPVGQGEWPWLAALFSDGHHKCDAILIAEQWLVVATSCLETEVKANWTAKLGSIRLDSVSPFDQQRAVLKVVKSQYTGNPFALMQLEFPVNTSDYVRPACLPSGRPLLPGTTCYALVWDIKKNALVQIQVRVKLVDDCANATSQEICARPTANVTPHACKEDINGMPLICEYDTKWSMRGFSTSNSVCQSQDPNAPHLYSQIGAHTYWINQIIGSSSNQ